MSSADTKTLIEQAVRRLEDEVPSFKSLKLVVKLELQARGGAPAWRVEVPGPTVSKDPAADSRVEVSMPRTTFNELAAEGTLEQWVEAYEHGQVKVSGDPGVVKLLGNVIERRMLRSRSL